MKLNAWLIPAMLSLTTAAVLAQDTTAAPPAGAAPVAPAQAAAAPMPETSPAAEPKPEKPRKKEAVKTRTLLDPAPSAVVKSDAVNVRGQPSFEGEILGHLKKGDTVTVEALITLKHAQKGEPAQWSQIAMPSDIPVWVNGQYVAADTKTVKARRINLRGGPGENYSVVGRLEKGAAITEVRSEKGWIAVEAPTNAYAFVASGFLDVQPVAAPAPPPAAVAAVAPSAAPTAPAPTAQSQADAELAALRQAVALQVASAPPGSPASPPDEPAAAPAVAAQPGGPRIVTREGYIHRALNVQAPTFFALHDVHNDSLIEFLDPQSNTNLSIFIGTRVTVTGPELMDPRWPSVPVLQVRSIGLIP
jgi:uncharacterized protein YgiM (DUF1202 family)